MVLCACFFVVAVDLFGFVSYVVVFVVVFLYCVLCCGVVVFVVHTMLGITLIPIRIHVDSSSHTPGPVYAMFLSVCVCVYVAVVLCYALCLILLVCLRLWLS